MEKLESRWPRHEARGCEGQRKGIERKTMHLQGFLMSYICTTQENKSEQTVGCLPLNASAGGVDQTGWGQRLLPKGLRSVSNHFSYMCARLKSSSHSNSRSPMMTVSPFLIPLF